MSAEIVVTLRCDSPAKCAETTVARHADGIVGARLDANLSDHWGSFVDQDGIRVDFCPMHWAQLLDMTARHERGSTVG